MTFEDDINKCLSVLQSGGIILYPTDTIWGIGCDATNETAIEKIYKLKKRAEEKSMIVLISNENELGHYVEQPDEKVFEFLHQTVKPTTIIYESAINLAKNCIHKDGSIAIRMTKDPFCKHLIEQFNKPIISTSANISGEKAPANFSEISDEIKNGVDFIVQHRQDDNSIASTSSIIKWNIDGTHIVIR
jgi:L-threonylcarbamoyladenylate synthase